MTSKRYGLVLTLGNAPTTPHRVEGVPGFFYPDVPTPVGAENEIPLDEARRIGKSSIDLELVEIPASEVKAAEDKRAETLEAVRLGLVENRKLRPKGGDAVQHVDEQQALAAAQAVSGAPKDGAPKDNGGK